MLKILLTRLRQGYRTTGWPRDASVLPDRFRGLPEIDPSRCADGCRRCVEACPTGSLAGEGGDLRLDLGRCLFCPECVAACPTGALTFTTGHRLAARHREDLVIGPGAAPPPAAALEGRMKRLFGRSLRLRQVSAGGCNACEADVNVLSTVVFDLGRFGVQFVASPRHADGLLVTGPVTGNMRLALQKTWEAVPSPRIVIASGACAVSGGPYAGHPETGDGVGSTLPVDLWVPGCPPHPLTLLDGILRLLGRL